MNDKPRRKKVHPQHSGNYACLYEIWEAGIDGQYYEAVNMDTGKREMIFVGFYEDLQLWIGEDADGVVLFTDQDLLKLSEHCDFFEVSAENV